MNLDDWLNDSDLQLIVQNMDLAVRYQYRQLDRGAIPDADINDLEDCLVRTWKVLGKVKALYEWRRRRNPELTPIHEITEIDLLD